MGRSTPPASLISELSQIYRFRPDSDLTSDIGNIEDWLSARVWEELTDYFVKNVPGARGSDSPGIFLLGNEPFETKMREMGPSIPSGLGLSVLSLKRSNQLSNPVAQERLSLEGCGTYSNAELSLDGRLAGHAESLLGIVKDIYETGYSWLHEYIRDCVSRLESDLSRRLYGLLRSNFPGEDSELAKNVWFLMVANDNSGAPRGFFVLDKIHSEHTFTLLDAARCQTSKSTATLFSHFLTASLAFDEMHSRIAVESGNLIDKNLPESLYHQRLPELVLAEGILYSDSVSLMPIVRDGREGYLVAVFPTKLKNQIVPTLTSCCDELRKLFCDRRDLARRALHKILSYRSTIITPEVGEVAGAFAAGFLKRLPEP